MINNANASRILASVLNNPQMQGNPVVSSVRKCLQNKDHNGLVELYKNTCQTMGQEPNPMFLK